MGTITQYSSDWSSVITILSGDLSHRMLQDVLCQVCKALLWPPTLYKWTTPAIILAFSITNFNIASGIFLVDKWTPVIAPELK
jgi:hypothetical protein